MSGPTVRYKVMFGREPKAQPRSPPMKSGTPATKPTSRLARQLALAHHVERLVEADVLAGYAQAARLLGVTRSRIAQLTALLHLSPEIQAAILTGELVASERGMREVVGVVEWREQGKVLWMAQSACSLPDT